MCIFIYMPCSCTSLPPLEVITGPRAPTPHPAPLGDHRAPSTHPHPAPLGHHRAPSTHPRPTPLGGHGPELLSALHSVYMCQGCCLGLPQPPLRPLSPHIHSPHLHLYSCSANMFIWTILGMADFLKPLDTASDLSPPPLNLFEFKNQLFRYRMGLR